MTVAISVRMLKPEMKNLMFMLEKALDSHAGGPYHSSTLGRHFPPSMVLSQKYSTG